MKIELLIVRHAVAFERDAERWPDDAARPLTPDGERSFRKAARGVRRAVRRPTAVLSSPFERALRTAELLHVEAGWPEANPFPHLEAGRGVEPLIAALGAWAHADRLAIVGHEPMLGTFCSLMTGGGAVKLKKGSVTALGVEAFERDGAILLALLPPRILRRLA